MTIRGRRRWLARPFAAVCAIAVALALVLAPPLAGTAAAATDPLKSVATATYTLDPAKGAVHVVVETSYTNRKPNSGGFFYFYDHVGLCVNAESSGIKVTDAQGALSFTTKKEPAKVNPDGGYFFPCSQVTTRLRHALLYKRTTVVRVAFDMVGDPRSSSRVRAGQGYATFPVWAWGDDHSATVVVHLPAGFVATVLQDPMTTKINADGSTDLTASPAVSTQFWAQIQATRRDGYQDETIQLANGDSVHLRALTDDTSWSDALAPDLRTGLPALTALIGLPIPKPGPIELRELYTPALENVVELALSQDQGFGVGPHRSPTDIAIPESLDEHAALSAAATIWFNDSLVTGRWVSSGLADEYAAQVLAGIGKPTTAPSKPDPTDPGAEPLELWVTPYLTNVPLKQQAALIKQTNAREAYGANASWYVVHALVASVGVERMRDVFAALANNEIAYVGNGDPETVDKADSWQRLLDLLEERSGGASADVAAVAEPLFTDYVLSKPNAALLKARTDARAAYAALVEKDADWGAPLVIRSAMGTWAFPAAMAAIADANEILDLRAQIETAANALGLTPSPGLQAAYENTAGDFDDARAAAKAELAALAAMAHARAVLDAPADLLTTIGLLGTTPRTSYDTAVAAFGKGDLAGATASAAATETAITGAADIGRQRLTIGGGVLALVVLLGFLFLLLRRRRRRVGLAVALAVPSVATLVVPHQAAGLSPDAPGPQPATPGSPADSSGPPPEPPSEAEPPGSI